jgi:hypothetical protein
MRVRLWRGALAATAALLASVFLVPSPAHADANTAWNIPVQRDWQWDYGREWFAVMWGPLSAGDCEERNAYVTLPPPDSQGNTVVGWGSGILLTHHTNHADVWHQSFVFRTRWGTPVLSVGGFDGPQMTQINQPYSNHVYRTVTVDPQLWPLIATVDWTGDC